MLRLIWILLLVAGLSACGNGGASGGAAPVYSISLAFTRLTSATPNPFRVTLHLTQDGQAESGAATDLQITLGRGSHNSVRELAPGQYAFTVTPVGTGEYPLSVSYQGASISRTPLVLNQVQPGWGQLMAVAGLVNTPG